ncbi:MAG TPA: hypothetical protein VKB53_04315 [Gammaproteobacteria bacterium]|jgi:hypothetical protein|nr:hypothetical protein [Gammaproteobacteria bacterium]HKH20119.1 hypothetical protein [Gammaproteobacteria bacterium]
MNKASSVVQLHPRLYRQAEDMPVTDAVRIVRRFEQGMRKLGYKR